MVSTSTPDRSGISNPRPLASRLARFGELVARLTTVPDAWLRGGARSSRNGVANKGGGLVPTLCNNYKQLVTAWRKAMRWTPGLDHALSVMLASITSTRAVGDQLWVKIIGPASCGKSTLCEAVSVNHKYVLAKSTIRGFHSGFSIDGGKEDCSLVSQLYGKTLVTKDGDTLLQAPNLGQILSEARDIYDGTSRTHYRNATSRDYCGLKMTWILCGTSSLRSIDSSELGERFLDCVIMEHIDVDMEEEIAWRVANKADRNLSIEANGKPETHYEPELAVAMQLTGGYIDYLRENVFDLMPSIEHTEESKRMCMKLGLFIAYMRARPSIRQEETAERELAARLVSQLIRLSKCLAVVTNRDSVDAEIMDRTIRVALDTARGQTLEIVKYLHEAAEQGLEPKTVAGLTSRSVPKTLDLLRFLKQLGVVEPFSTKRNGVTGRVRWRLSDMMATLYEEVVKE